MPRLAGHRLEGSSRMGMEMKNSSFGRGLAENAASSGKDSPKLRHYNEEHRRLAQQKVNALSEAGKDLVYFLLHHGKTEAASTQRSSGRR